MYDPDDYRYRHRFGLLDACVDLLKWLLLHLMWKPIVWLYRRCVQ